jgi:hypothetical protein
MSFFLKDSAKHPEVDAFWAERADAIGEEILANGLAQYQSGGEEEGPLWGLVYVTPTRLFFQHFAQQNWFSSLMGGTSAGGLTKQQEKSPRERDVTLQWWLDRYSRIEDESDQSRFRALIFGRNAGKLRLVSRSGGKAVVFTVEHNRNAVLSALRRGLQG